jgi:hypothetical protein
MECAARISRIRAVRPVAISRRVRINPPSAAVEASTGSTRSDGISSPDTRTY